VIQAECLYRDGQAGILTAAEILSEPATYPFTPYRSLAHLELVQALDEAERVRVIVVFDQQRIEMYATAISPESITLMPVR
jgi:hypothetical protein